MEFKSFMKYLQFCLYLSHCNFLEVMSVTSSTTCTVTVDQGTLQGAPITTLLATDLCAYFGIPYAMPPVGNLRFREPKEATRWSGILNAEQRKKKVCIGIAYPNTEMVEDCLYLDIYTPQLKEESNSKFPVLVYIPGERYLGDNSFLFGPDYMTRNELILVVLNYRVGVLGFLSTGNSAALGNYGLKDQVQALKWIKRNIEDFGGDPDNVTIFGHGLGGACVHYHILSPMSKGLFHHAISLSGTALNPSLRPTSNPNRLVQQLGLMHKCQNDNDVELVDCLREVNGSQFANITSMRFAPVIETVVPDIQGFLTKHPLDIIISGDFNKVPWLVGTVNNEGAASAVAFIQNTTAVDIWNNNPDDILVSPSILELLDDEELLDKHWSMLLDFYFGNSSHRISPKKIDSLMQLYGDRLYYFGIYISTVLHHLAGHDKIFKYNFAYNGRTHFRNFSNDLISHVGADHGDDLIYMFKFPTEKVFPPSEPEMYIAHVMTQILFDFIKSGDPGSSMNISWNHAGYKDNDEVHIRYIDITAPNNMSSIILNFTTKEDLFQERMVLWLSLPLYENDVYYSVLNVAFHVIPIPILTTIPFILMSLFY